MKAGTLGRTFFEEVLNLPSCALFCHVVQVLPNQFLVLHLCIFIENTPRCVHARCSLYLTHLTRVRKRFAMLAGSKAVSVVLDLASLFLGKAGAVAMRLGLPRLAPPKAPPAPRSRLAVQEKGPAVHGDASSASSVTRTGATRECCQQDGRVSGTVLLSMAVPG